MTTRKMKRTRTSHPRVHMTYKNVSETWKNGEGRRNIVEIAHGKGMKRVEQLGPEGVLKSQTRKLTAAEQSKILQGQFVPGLWRNCRLKCTPI